MMKATLDLGSDFLFAKLHGHWSGAADGRRLLHLLYSRNLQGVARILSSWQIDPSDRAGVQKALSQRLINQLATLMPLMDRRTAAYYARVIDRYYLQNLKVLLHCWILPAERASAPFLVIDSPCLPAVDLDRFIACRNLDQCHACLPENDFTGPLRGILSDLEDSRDLFAAECRMDALYYRLLGERVARLPLASRGTARKLFGQEVDMLNLVTALRNAAVYRFPEDRVADLFLAGGRELDLERFLTVSQAESIAASAALLPSPYHDLVERWGAEGLDVCENVLLNRLYREAWKAFRNFNNPALSVVAFPFLKTAEALNVARLFEALHFEMAPKQIQALLVGADYAA